MWLCLGSVRPLFKRVCKGLCKVIFLVVSCGVVLGRCTRGRCARCGRCASVSVSVSVF